jgi:class 3 adenylate cyclase
LIVERSHDAEGIARGERVDSNAEAFFESFRNVSRELLSFAADDFVWADLYYPRVVVCVRDARAHVAQAQGPERAGLRKCGYQVRGLTTFTCPECGSDLREVGIAAAGAPETQLFSLSGKIMLGVLVWIPFAALFTALLARLATHEETRNNFAIIASLISLAALVALCRWIVVRHHAPKLAFTSEAPIAPAFPVGATRRTRNLSIVFADMHDYTTRVARESREGVIDLIRNTRQIIEPLVQRHGGTIVKTIGDAFLITFESPTDAVLTARQIQGEMSRRNGTLGDSKHVHLRIGISTGEVALEHNDVYGDPVNIANRIQQLAQPGEILFNEATFHAMKQSEVPHEVAGDFDLKGVNGTAKLYRALPLRSVAVSAMHSA